MFVCDKELAENFGISGCQFEDSIEKLMKSVNLLCSVVRSEGVLCGTALANVNLPKTKQHVVGMQIWGALAWIPVFGRVDGPARFLGGEHVHTEILVAAYFVQKVSFSFQKAVHDL